MTISNTASYASYIGNGSQQIFDVANGGEGIYFESSDELRVTVQDGYSITTKILNVDYTVSGAGSDSGQVTFLTAPADGTTIRIERHTPLTQELSLSNGAAFNPTNIMAALDKTVRMVQDLSRQVSNASAGANVQLAFDYTWDTGTADADPGSGKVRANNSNLLSATYLYISETDADGTARATEIQSLDDSTDAIRGYLVFIDGAGTRVRFRIVNTIIDAGTYNKIPVRYDSGVTSLTAINGSLIFERAEGIVTDSILAASAAITATATPYNSDPQSGWFADYEGFSAARIILTQNEVQGIDESGGWRSALSIEHQDNDSTDYSGSSYQTISDGLRVGSFGKQSAGVYQSQYKDLIGISTAAIGRIEWANRGVSGICADAIQYGQGIASNEFVASNPAAASSQSLSMAAVQGIVSGKKAAADGTHYVRAFLATNLGKLATSAFEALSSGTDGDNGQFSYLLNGSGATISTAAIQMPASASGDVGTRILYDTGDYTEFIRSANTFVWCIAGSGELALAVDALYPIANDGLSLGVGAAAFADLFLASGGVINFANGNLTMTHSTGALAITGVMTVASDTATPAGGSTSARLLFGTTAGFGIYYGSGAPTVSAAQGSLYLRSDGSSTTTRLYVNTNGSTGWTHLTAGA